MSDSRSIDDPRLAALASRQHGVVSVGQLRELGFDKHAVHNRVRVGRLHRVHQGVYAVGHRALGEYGRFTAAVLACGGGAVLSHGSAAVLWGFLKPLEGPIHVTSPTTDRRRKREGIVLHRSPSLDRGGEATRRERIPVTTPRRTIEDLEGAVEPRLYRRAKKQAEFMKLELRLPTDRSRSDLERDFLRFLTQHRFPHPEVNVKVGDYEVDFLWRSQRLVVETDFFEYHRGHQSFEDDHQRELDLRRAGYAVRRYTGAQIRDHSALVVADLREVLGGGP